MDLPGPIIASHQPGLRCRQFRPLDSAQPHAHPPTRHDRSKSHYRAPQTCCRTARTLHRHAVTACRLQRQRLFRRHHRDLLRYHPTHIPRIIRGPYSFFQISAFTGVFVPVTATSPTRSSQTGRHRAFRRRRMTTMAGNMALRTQTQRPQPTGIGQRGV